MGLVFCLLGTLAFGLLGCVAKVAERRQARSSSLVVFIFVWATLAMLLRTVTGPSPVALPWKAAVVAAVCGACAAVAFLSFQTSIQLGSVAVAWLMMNLSAMVPAIVSVLVYGETLTSTKIVALGLAVGSLFFLFQGKREEAGPDALSGKNQRRGFWTLLMAVILLTNGMSSFGLKVITAWGLPEAVKFPYLTVWYGAGLASIGLPAMFQGLRWRAKEIGWAGLMAGLSIAGQVAMATALQMNLPGHIVFPVAIGGSVFIVTLAGRLVFGERMDRITVIGTLVGIVAIVLLGVS